VTFISKTDYVLWRACPKNAWLRIHRPDIYCATEVTEFEQSVIDMGIEVECVARGLFPEGLLVPGSKAEAQENAARYLALNTGTLFQAVFEREQLLAAIDVLERDTSTGEYSIFEIKSSTRAGKEHLRRAYAVKLENLGAFTEYVWVHEDASRSESQFAFYSLSRNPGQRSSRTSRSHAGTRRSTSRIERTHR